LGGTAVHSIRQGDMVLKKGTVIGRAEVAALEAAGVKQVVVVRMDEGDVGEDAAAAQIAAAAAGDGVTLDRAFTGRCNLFAKQAGVLVVDKDAIDRLNRADEAVTLATLPAFKPVVEGEMLATVKIIPFAVEAGVRDLVLKEAVAAHPLVQVVPYKIRKLGVISTQLPGLSAKVIDKTVKILVDRITPAGAMIVAERRIEHSQPVLAKAPNWSSCSALPRSPTAAMSFLQRSRKSVAASSISACRSIPEIFCC
jgi:molybdenum cofactor cytidylyltransferase